MTVVLSTSVSSTIDEDVPDFLTTALEMGNVVSCKECFRVHFSKKGYITVFFFCVTRKDFLTI